MDPYKILDLPRNYTLEQLRKQYKRIALRTHPDASGLKSDYLFKLVTASYKALLKELEARDADKQFVQLKSNANAYFSKDDRTPQSTQEGNMKNFNIKRFNNIFEKNKIDDVDDTGYGSWMSKSKPEREELGIASTMKKFDQNRFNQAFDAQPVNKERKMLVYKEPEAVSTIKNIGFAELGITTCSDFSGDNLTKKSLNFTDYKMAHTTTRLVDKASLKQRKDYFIGNVKHIETNP